MAWKITTPIIDNGYTRPYQVVVENDADYLPVTSFPDAVGISSDTYQCEYVYSRGAPAATRTWTLPMVNHSAPTGRYIIINANVGGTVKAATAPPNRPKVRDYDGGLPVSTKPPKPPKKKFVRKSAKLK